MPSYSCERCLKEFGQKSHYNKHITKKNPCPNNAEKMKEMALKMIQEEKQKEMKKNIHDIGQYFTTNDMLRKTVYDFILNDSDCILEPSVGCGHLVEYVLSKKPSISFDLYEIDESIPVLPPIQKNDVVYTDFLKVDNLKLYDTIIGNPPFVKTKSGNLYIDFIEKCFNHLSEKGELIFIVPSDFIKLTSSGDLINTMMEHGTFTHFFHPHNENLFTNASIDIVVFRYCKDTSLPKKTLLNNQTKYLINTNGILTFADNDTSNLTTFEDYFDVHVGMVTGKESVFKNSTYGNISLRNGKEQIDSYILLDTFPTQSQEINDYMLSHKDELITRKIRKFTDSNWFEWGALRNYETMKNKVI